MSKLGKRAAQFPRRREWCPKTTQLPLPCGSPLPAPMVTFPGGCSLRVSSGFSGADFQVPAPAPMAEAVTAGPPPATCCFSVSAGGGAERCQGGLCFGGTLLLPPDSAMERAGLGEAGSDRGAWGTGVTPLPRSHPPVPSGAVCLGREEAGREDASWGCGGLRRGVHVPWGWVTWSSPAGCPAPWLSSAASPGRAICSRSLEGARRGGHRGSGGGRAGNTDC